MLVPTQLVITYVIQHCFELGEEKRFVNQSSLDALCGVTDVSGIFIRYHSLQRQFMHVGAIVERMLARRGGTRTLPQSIGLGRIITNLSVNLLRYMYVISKQLYLED